MGLLAEMVKGKGMSITFSLFDRHGKRLFSNDTDSLFLTKHLNKTGAYSKDSEWELCIDLIRNLCTFNPEDRLTAIDALHHPFIKLAKRLEGTKL